MSQFAAAFGGIQEARKEQQAVVEPETPVPAANRPQKPSKATPPTQALAKSRDPAYEPVKLFMNIAQRRKAERKWEDAGGRDLSSLIETLLRKYLGA